jgi:hypothetical protein
MSAKADYSMDKVEGVNPLHVSKREVYFEDYQNFFGIGDKIGNMLEHLLLLKE